MRDNLIFGGEVKSLILSALIASALFIIGCSEEASVSDPLSNYPEYAERILGEWNLGSSKMTFDKNGNFTNTFGMQPFDMNTTVIQTGKYEIIDSVLILKPTKWDFSNPEIIEGLSIVQSYYEISFTNNVLTLLPVELFTKVENDKTELLGTWKTIKWVYHKVSTPELIEYAGREEVFYEFLSKDSAYHGYKYLDETKWDNPNWKINYEYNPPDIIIPGPGIYNRTVEFKNGKMYWYNKFNTLSLTKN